MLLPNGKKKRELQVRGRKSVKLEREYDICPECGQGIFPQDKELELLPGGLSPHGYESLVRMADWTPFKRVAEMLEDFMGIRVDKSTRWRYAEAAGKVYENLQTEDVKRLERDMPEVPAAVTEKIQVWQGVI